VSPVDFQTGAVAGVDLEEWLLLGAYCDLQVRAVGRKHAEWLWNKQGTGYVIISRWLRRKLARRKWLVVNGENTQRIPMIFPALMLKSFYKSVEFQARERGLDVEAIIEEARRS